MHFLCVCDGVEVVSITVQFSFQSFHSQIILALSEITSPSSKEKSFFLLLLSGFLSADKIYSKDLLDVTQNKWIVGAMLFYGDKAGVINWMYVIQTENIR